MATKESLKRKNFSPDEFFYSKTAEENGLINYPPKGQELSILTALMSTTDMMQEVRDLLGHPIRITSGYRCSELNKLVGGSKSSQHLQGLACDFVCPEFGTPLEVVKYLQLNDFLVDQCLCEGSWVHISRSLPKKVFNLQTNRMMYGSYLVNKNTGQREFNTFPQYEQMEECQNVIKENLERSKEFFKKVQKN